MGFLATTTSVATNNKTPSYVSVKLVTGRVFASNMLHPWCAPNQTITSPYFIQMDRFTVSRKSQMIDTFVVRMKQLFWETRNYATSPATQILVGYLIGVLCIV